jgi:excisionase family DNA binding protein
MVHDSIGGERARGGMPVLMTASDVAAWLKTTISTVYAKAERGTLPGAVRLGRRLYFIRSELLAYVEQGRVSRSGETGGGT